DDSVVTTIPIGDAQVSIVGSVITIDLTSDLDDSTSYYVLIDAGAITDPVGNPYAGIISDKTEWNFLTVFGSNGGNIITLVPGWNVFSTPRELDSIVFSNGGLGIIFYKLEGGAYPITTTAAITNNIKPLEGFLVNNTSGSSVDVYLNYADGVTDGQEVKSFNKDLIAGWNIVGVANQSFEANDSNYTEISIRDAFANISNTGSIIDYTTDDFAGGDNDNKIDSSGEIFSIPTTDTEKFEEFKSYLVFINQDTTYGGSQKDNEVLP
ncbi:Ig-like domain-containing protein, partial [Candidatus Gracilibacteria bacterium]|nr:Ig-like domain-containing protein [Candidatus Gracilibacteria bacterium]